jgi:hypothetical protein
MSNYTLLIFEGRNAECNIADNLKQFYLEGNDKTIVQASFGHNIYQLYRELKNDNGLGLFGVVCEAIQRRGDLETEVLQIEESKVSDIYLFFDYDPHTSNANDEQLIEMLRLFDNSQNDGMLCISYPMVEAIRHIKDPQANSIFYSIGDSIHYKRYLNQVDGDNELINISRCYQNWGLYTQNVWKAIIRINLARANELVNNEFSLPNNIITQQNIFQSQLVKHIRTNGLISVISAFPLMLHEYYGDKLDCN